MGSMTIVIPLFRPDRYRQRNLNYTLSKLVNMSHPIILIEQTHSDVSFYTNIYKDRVNHVTMDHDSNTICKSLLINSACEHVQTTHMWVVDTDFCIKFHDVTTDMLQHDVIQPFHYTKDLTDQETIQLIEHDRLEVSFYEDTTTRHINTFGALSFIMNKQTFMNIGGMDESYTGWGYEDIDLFMRINESVDQDIHITRDIYGVHLWHPPSPVKPVSRLINKKTFNAKGYTMKKVNQILKERYYPGWSFKNI